MATALLVRLAAPVPPPAISAPIPAPADVLACFDRAADIDYTADPEDQWQSPEDTARLDQGDCEDKALYLYQLLRQAGLEAQIMFGVVNLQASDVMHAWVEIDIAGQTYVLDPTQGFIARRDHMAPGCHTPVLGMPSVMRKVAEFEERTGLAGINSYYSHMLGMIQPRDERVAGR